MTRALVVSVLFLVGCGPADVAGLKYSLGVQYDNNTSEIALPEFGADGVTGTVAWVNSHRRPEAFHYRQLGSSVRVDLDLSPAVEYWQLEAGEGAHELKGAGIAVRADGVVHASLNGDVAP